MELDGSAAFLQKGTECLHASLRRWNVTVTPWFRKTMRNRRRPLQFEENEMSAHAFVHTFYVALHDAMPKWPSIFGS